MPSRKVKGSVATNVVGSTCEFEFEIEDTATEKEIEEAAHEEAMQYVEWNYEVVDND